MARVVVLGAGVAGHAAALHLKRKLGKDHDVILVSPSSQWNWIPSKIWVGISPTTERQMIFPLDPVYRKKKIEFHQAKATMLLPEGDDAGAAPKVELEFADGGRGPHKYHDRHDRVCAA